MVHVVGPWYAKGARKPGATPERPSKLVDRLLQLWNLFLSFLSVVMLIGIAGPLFAHLYVPQALVL